MVLSNWLTTQLPNLSKEFAVNQIGLHHAGFFVGLSNCFLREKLNGRSFSISYSLMLVNACSFEIVSKI